ncbi:hypothetical protein [Antrihabitans cavernicola]|uniref:Low molecular weight antigen MTB12-like C-terminal domain-containing protein n=1 Tax=Antrihabitans cavernicola TaxID=2495913 RepID=A0A5A7SGN2_9NOCA|nr:hypothetical protein [Spelaeibacter cavernicola]KAA0023645.1 hypothetical protein FOY51_09720 [Spelaeibacter cavernicola]
MILRKHLFATVAIVAALGLASCSSDDSTDSAAASSTVASSSAVAAAPAADAPSAQQLQDSLTLLADPVKSATEKAATVVNGDARLANITTMTQGLANYPVTFAVADIKVEGNKADAKVTVTSPHGSAPLSMTWENVGGTWKLSDASNCQLLAMGRAPCS